MKNMFFCCFIGSLFAAVRRLGETFPVFGRNASGVWAKRSQRLIHAIFIGTCSDKYFPLNTINPPPERYK